ncbi:MAG TPA: alkaline phosphatase [Longimicrobiaceae bacterium]|nr:alkaline phosphatase [Longimicrobiaceae bacterium]
MTKTSLFACTISVALLGCAPATSGGPPSLAGGTGPEVRNIILMIADGAGPGLWSAAAYGADQLAVKRMPIGGIVDTRSARHRVTDSAAAASVYATGERVTNRTISVGPDCPVPASNDTTVVAWATGCEPIETWFEIARAKGKGTGLLTTTAIVDATPASFVAHSPSRYWGDLIAEQMVDAGLDVLLGGGRRHFTAMGRNDGRDLLGPMCERSDCFTSAEAFLGYTPTERPLVGLFAQGDMDSANPRTLSISVMVEAALAKLGRSPNGFVAMFETESTDNTTHDNAPIEVITDRILEFDRAVGVVLDFAQRTPGTLVIVTGDHDTAGIALVEAGIGTRLEYANTGHSAAPVPLFAEGPRAEQFGGYRENYEIGRMLMEIVRGW